MNGIQKLVSDGIGISFLYEKASLENIKNKKIRELNIVNLNAYREFNFVMLKENKNKNKYIEIFKMLQKLYV